MSKLSQSGRRSLGSSLGIEEDDLPLDEKIVYLATLSAQVERSNANLPLSQMSSSQRGITTIAIQSIQFQFRATRITT